MNIDAAKLERDSLLESVGKGILNTKFPKEFEMYTIAFELTDENYNTLKYFVFPVNPSSIEENKPQLTNIKKTLAGVSVLSTPTFVPTDITLSGTFGRKFKVLLGKTFVDLISTFTDGTLLKANGINSNAAKFSDNVKTGYGCIKILEEIINDSNAIGAGGVYRKLIFHNPALGNSYIVKVRNLRLSQNEQSNMIWNYSFQIKSIAPIESLQTQKQQHSNSVKLGSTSYAQAKVNEVVNGLTTLLSKGQSVITN